MLKDNGFGSRRKRSASRGFVVLLVVGIAVACGLVFLIRQPLRRVAGTLGFVRNEAIDVVGQTFNVATMSKWGMESRIRELESQVAEYQARHGGYSLLQEENTSLRNILSYHVAAPVPHVAGVIGKPSLTLSNRLILDQGSDQGVLVGDYVGLYGSIALGRVASVTASTSVVELYSAPGNENQGELRREGILLPIRGNGGGNFEVEVPRDIVVSDGDIITLANNPARVLGVVKAVESDARDPFQTVLARTPVNIHELTYVELTR